MAPPRPQKKANKRTPSILQKDKGLQARQEPPSPIPIELQQLLLNIFKDTFSDRLESNIKPLLQEIKGHLYNRDFLTAFGKEEYLEAYAARWSPSRALGYLQVLESLNDELRPFTETGDHSEDPQWKVVSLGGGAGAEIVALAGLLHWLDETVEEEHGRELHFTAIDIADWAKVIDKLRGRLVAPPPLSQYASAAAREANVPLVDPPQLFVAFQQHDVLNTPFDALVPALKDANLVTLMFTLNELYSTSLSLTQKFLLNLTGCLPPGSRLLVVDSPGSYSTVNLNGAEKKYPMQWLLDHTLLGKGAKDEAERRDWEKVKEDESRWFRLDSGLRYPIELENMRFQLHLYRRLG